MNKNFYIQSRFKSKSIAYSQCLALESRMVFDGAAIATAVEIQNTVSNQLNANSASEPVAHLLSENIPPTLDHIPNIDTTNGQAQLVTNPDLSGLVNAHTVTGINTDQVTSIIVVDPRAETASLLPSNPPANTQIIVLDPARDGFLQITEQLQNQHDVTQLDIIPWTHDNRQWLGSQSLVTTLDPVVSSNLIAWNDALADNAHLVFHGQNSMSNSWLDHVSTLTNTQTSWLLDSNTNSVLSEPAKTVFFIDSAVQDVSDIISSIDQKNTEVVYLDATKDGLTQIADYLDGRSNIASVQIISHAKEATLYLGNDSLTNDNLASHAAQLATIGHALTMGGDILLYGCELAKSTDGSQFVDTFAYLTNADVAASTDYTGATNKGGNWTLEYTAGTIEANVLAASHYQDILAPTTVNSVAITSAGIYTTGSVVTASVVFSGVEDVTGTPSLILNIGGQLRTATYAAGSGTNTLQFTYTTVAGDADTNGISVNANSLALNGGTINNIGFAATLSFTAVADNPTQLVVSSTPDTTAPILQSAVASGTNLTLTYNEIGSGLSIAGTPPPTSFIVTDGGIPVTVTAVTVNSVAQTVDLTLASVIKPTDTNILVSYSTGAGASDIQDSAGNTAASFITQPVANTMPTFNLNSGALTFDNPTVEVTNGVIGTGGQNTGDIVLFNNVVTLNGQAIDAIVTTVNNTNITYNGFDTASGTLGGSLDPSWFELDTNVTAPGGASTIKFEFIKHGTYNPLTGTGVDVLLQNVILNSYDIDVNQFQEFGGFASYTVASDTQLVQTTLATNFVHFAEMKGTSDTSAIGSTLFDQFRVTALYKEINSFQIKTGADIAGPAYYYLDFSAGPNWNTPVSYNIPTVVPLTTNNFTPTITGTYAQTVINSLDTAQSLTVTVNGVPYTTANGLIRDVGGVIGTWALSIPTPLDPKTYDVVVDTGYGQSPATITVHTKDSSLNELTIINNPPVNTVPATQNVNAGVQTAIIGLSVTDIDANLASTQLSVSNGVLNVDLTGGATISGGANGSTSLTLSGSEAQIKAALASLKYTGVNNDILTIKSTDSFKAVSNLDTVVINVNNPPVANNDTVTGNADNPVIINVLGNDKDPNNNINLASVQIVGTTNLGDPLVVANQGTWTVDKITGAITFTPIAGFVGSPTAIQYTVKDTGGLVSGQATVTVNNPPIARPDTITGVGGNPVIINILGNDGGTGVNLNPSSVQIVGTTKSGDPLVVANEGTWSVNPTTGVITFTPIVGFVGSPTAIQYTVKDTGGLVSGQATITVNNPPIASPDTVTANAGNPVIINILSNDGGTGVNLNPASVQIVGTTKPGDSLVVANQGTWSINTTTGEITFTPFSGFTGSPDPINYTVEDTSGLISAPTTVTVTMNQLPIAVNDTNTATEDGPAVTGDIIDNETSLGDVPTTVTFASQGINTITIGSVFITAAGGILILNADGSYSYTPPNNIPIGGLIERFNYTIGDVNGDISSAILTISVNPRPNTTGSLIQLSNPVLPFVAPLEPFFVAKPLQSATVLDLSLYIPTPDGVISLTGSLRDQVVLELKPFSFDIPKWSFSHTKPNEQLVFEASYPDGSSLPDWLRFNPKLLRFSGTPPRGAHDEQIMVTATDSYGNEVHAIFTVHVNKEQARPEHKSLALDLKLMGLSDKVLEKNHQKEKVVAKPALSERINKVGKFGKLHESRVLLESSKTR